MIVGSMDCKDDWPNGQRAQWHHTQRSTTALAHPVGQVPSSSRAPVPPAASSLAAPFLACCVACIGNHDHTLDVHDNLGKNLAILAMQKKVLPNFLSVDCRGHCQLLLLNQT